MSIICSGISIKFPNIMSHEINMPFPVVRLRAACRIYWLRSNFVFTPFQIDLKVQGKQLDCLQTAVILVTHR